MKVRLYIRVKLANGSRQYLEPVYAANGKLKPGFALIEGRPEHHPEGIYHLRYLRDGKRIWQSVGSDAQNALTQKLKRELSFSAQRAGFAVVAECDARVQSTRPLVASIDEYLFDIKVAKSKKTHDAYSLALRGFLRLCHKSSLESVTRRDVLTYISQLRAKENSNRTVANRLDYLKIFFNHHQVPWPLLKTDRVKFTDKTVSAYSAEEIRRLMAAASRDECELLQFLLCTGLREQEASHATWRDISFASKTFKVEEKLDIGFTPKDREEGIIPIPDSLIALLQQRRRRYPDARFIFPHPSGKPNGHLLRVVKRIAFRAGLNCGECFNKAGKCCAESPTCTRFILHRFRKTFATMHHEVGVSARTIQRWLRHSDLETTLRYLAGGDDQSERTRAQVNNTFSGLLD